MQETEKSFKITWKTFENNISNWKIKHNNPLKYYAKQKQPQTKRTNIHKNGNLSAGILWAKPQIVMESASRT